MRAPRCAVAVAPVRDSFGAMPPVPQSWDDVIALHLAAHPSATAQDLRKLVHQGVFGPGHAITDRASALDRLVTEAATMGAWRGEPLLEPIAPRGTWVRVHLRAWVDAGRPLGPLFEAFLASAALTPTPSTAIERATVLVGQALRQRDAARHAGWLREMTAWRAADWPAVHHSPAMIEAEAPAYRVVAGTLVASLVD